MDVKQLLKALGDIGVKLSVKDGKLKSQSAKGVLTKEWQQKIRDNKEDIIQFLSVTRSSDGKDGSLVPIARSGHIPLSYAQQRLWFLDQLEEGSTFYNIPAAYQIDGYVSLDVLEKVFAEIVARHESLRTYFPVVNGEPIQKISPDLSVAILTHDLTHLPEEKKQREANRLQKQEADTPFNLTELPLIRITLLRLEETKHILLITIHHIVADGWSLGVLLNEFEQLYSAFLAGEASPLKALSVQYADFSHWQKQWLSGERLSRQLDYWKKQLVNAPTLLNLPTDFPRPEILGHQGGIYDFTIPAKTLTELKQLCDNTQSTLFMVLLTVFNMQLSRYSGDTDICVGTPIANRKQAEVEPLIGFFVNSLVLRVDLSGDPLFTDLLAMVKKTTLEAYDNQDVSFDQLVETLNPVRSRAHGPLFQVMLALNNGLMEKINIPGLDISEIPTQGSSAKNDLRLAVVEKQGELMCSIEYNAALFSRKSMMEFGEHFNRLLAAVVQVPDKPISDYSYLSQEELQLRIDQWNSIQPGFSHISDSDLLQQDSATNVLTLFLERVKQQPADIAIRYAGKNVTYGELDQLSSRIALSLQKNGDVVEQVIGVYLSDPIMQVAALLGTFKAGGIYLCLSRDYPEQRLLDMLSVANPAYIITNSAGLDRVEQLIQNTSVQIVNLEKNLPAATDSRRLSTDLTHSHNYEDTPCYLYFTSGSTGKPKGILGSARGLAHFVQWEIKEFDIQPGCRVSQLTIPTFDVYLRDVFTTLCAGGTLCIPEYDTILDAARLSTWLADEAVELVHCVPTLFRTLLDLDLDTTNLPALKHILLAGEALTPTDIKRWYAKFIHKVELINLYGPTETTLAKFFYRIPFNAVAEKYIPVGQPLPGTQAIVLNSNLEPCRVGEAGEIFIRTPYRSFGYYRRPDLNQVAFLANPFSSAEEDILYRTGDLGCVLSDGNFRLLGRKDFQVKIRGMRIELGDIETALANIWELQSSAVAACEDTQGQMQLVAYVVPKIAGIDIEAIRQKLHTYLPDYMVPSVYQIMESLPTTASGKVDRKRLPKPDFSKIQASYVAPTSALEKLVCAIWQDVLHQESVGIHDNFFTIGGHSLLATRVVSKINADLDIEIQLRLLFEKSTVAEFAEAIEALISKDECSEKIPPIGVIEQDARGQCLPVSFGQQRLWFLDQYEQDASVYNIPLARRIIGRLDIPSLQQALDQVCKRHEILRTRFIEKQGVPYQFIDNQIHVILKHSESDDLTAFSHDERERILGQRLLSELNTPFNLHTGPLFRARLFTLAENEYALMLTLHHIVTDGWANSILFNELTECYGALIQGKKAELAALPIQYADYACWQQSAFESSAVQQQLGYWRNQLADCPPLCTFPTDFPRPPVATYRGATFNAVVPPELSSAIRNVSETAGTTMFVTLLTAFKILLSRYSGQTDICIGTPIANRHRIEVEPLIGFFINTLVMRSNIDSQRHFKELLGDVHSMALDAYANQDVPFEKLVDMLNPKRDASYAPLFQVMFALHNAPRRTSEMLELTLEDIDIPRETAKYDLSLNVIAGDDGLKCSFEYCTDIFSQKTVKTLANCYLRLLEAITQAPDKKVAYYSLLSKADAENMIRLGRGSSTLINWKNGIHDQVQNIAEQNPDAIAIEFQDTAVTYAELNQRSNQLANYLLAQGVKQEQIIALCAEPSPEMILGILGILKAGATYLPLDFSLPNERINYILEDAKPQFILQHSALNQPLPVQDIKTLVFDWHAADLSKYSTVLANTSVSGNNLAYVIYTSGSTGKPKGTLLRHSGLCNFISGLIDQLGLSAGNRCLQFASFNFDASVWEVFSALCSGATLCLAKKDKLTAGPVLQDTLNQLRIDTAILPPAVLPELSSEHLPRLKTLSVGGEACAKEVAEKWARGRRLLNAYGPTETTICATLFPCPDVITTAPPIGKAIPNTHVYVLDQNLNPVPFGVTGELYISGEGLARGYLNQPGLTAERFIPDPFSAVPGSRMYQSGDLVRLLDDGNIQYVGRADQQIKLRGFRIELGEVEQTLKSFAEIKDALVKLQNLGGQNCLIAYVIAYDAPLDNQVIRNRLQQFLPDYMLPTNYMWLDAWPINTSGKIDHNALPKAEVEHSVYLAPRNDLEQSICDAWEEVLQRDGIGVFDNFFDLGGHSLLATRITSILRDKFNLDVPVSTLFNAPTVALLAETLHEKKKSILSAIVPGVIKDDATRGFPLSYAQQRLWFMDQLEANSAFYNVSTTLRLTGELLLSSFEYAFNQLIQRHASLRTLYPTVEGEPQQIILTEYRATIAITDLRHLNKREQETHIDQWLSKEAQAPFDLSNGPLFRPHLLQLADTEWIFNLSMHHIVADGWSFGIIEKELSWYYRQDIQQTQTQLPPLPIQYSDYALWQRSAKGQKEIAEQTDYWLEQLQDAPARIALPLDKPRPPMQTYNGAKLKRRVRADQLTQLLKLSHQHQSSLFMTLTAAFNVLLSRYSGQTDICLGTPVANRNRAEIEPLIGVFVNTLVLRVHTDSKRSFIDHLHFVRDTTLAAYENQDVPFEKLVDLLKVERDTRYTPLFQAMIVLQNNPSEGWHLPRVDVEPILVDRGVAKYDLTLGLVEDGDELLTLFEYNTDLFAPKTIARMADNFIFLLDQIISSPEKQLHQLPLMPTEEIHRWVYQWNESSHDADDVVPALISFHQAFSEQARKTPDATAVVFNDEQLTYSELDERSNKLAHYLIEQDVTTDSVVALCLVRSLDMLIAILAVQKAGAAYLPLDPDYPQQRLAYILQDASPCALLVHASCLDTFSDSAVSPIVLDSINHVIEGYPAYFPDVCVDGKNLAYVIYTSGSSGKPKGVLVTHESVINMANAHILNVHRQHKPGRLKTSLNASYVFDAFVAELVLLLDGHTLYLIPDDVRLSPEGMVDFFAQHQLDALDTSPAQLKYLLEHTDSTFLPPVVMFGGEAIDDVLWQKIKRVSSTAFFNAYGPTECTVDVALAHVNECGDRPVIGRPQRNSSLYVLDDDLNPVPQGAVGELYVSGMSLARGYLNRPDMTAEKFIPNPFTQQPGTRMYRTGDLVRMLACGDLEFVGRADDQIKIRGFRIEVGEVETTLLAHKEVRNALVMPLELNGHQTLTAYVVPKILPYPIPVSETAAYLPEGVNARELPDGIDRLCLVKGDGGQMVLASCAQPMVVRDEANRNYQVMTLGTAPYLRAKLDELHLDVWPEYFNGSPVLQNNWQTMYDCFPQGQMVIMESLDSIVGGGNSVLLNWDGSVSDIPKGWDGALLRALEEQGQQREPNTLVVLAGVIDRQFKSRKLAGLIIQAFKQIAASLQLEHLLVALRPIAKTQYQTMPLNDYVNLRNSGGKHSDAWLRLHCDAGGVLLACEEASQYIEGSLDEWASWSGRTFDCSGDEFLTDTLAKVSVDIESDRAFYYDPCIWLEHSIPYEQASCMPMATEVLRHIHAQIFSSFDRLVIVNSLPEMDDQSAWTNTLTTLNRYARKPLSANELRQHVTRLLPAYMVPAHFVLLEDMPLTRTGKVDRKALPEPDVSEVTEDYVAPENYVERILCDVWQDVLSLPRVGVTDNFFDLGGDSILSIRAIARAKHHGIVFTAKQLFANQTIRQLGGEVHQQTKQVIAQEAVEGEMGLLPIHYEFFNERASDHFNQAVLLHAPEKLCRNALVSIIHALFLRHDAFRLRFQFDGQRWRGWHHPYELGMVEQSVTEIELQGSHPEEWKSEFEQYERTLQASLSLEYGPLLRAGLCIYPDGKKQLLLIVHHMIVDGISWRILLKDIEQGFNQWLDKSPVKLEAKTSSYQSWSRFLQRYAKYDELQREREFWIETLRAPVDALPEALVSVSDDTMAATETVDISLNKDLTHKLLTQCHTAYATQINDLLLAGVMLGLNAWADIKRLRFTLEGHGREELSDELDLTETLGWFTSAYPVWLEMTDEKNTGLVIEQIKQRLRSVPSKGIGYGVLKYLSNEGGVLASNQSDPVVVFNYLGQFGENKQEENDWDIVADFNRHTVALEHPRNCLLGFNGGIRSGELCLTLDYNRFRYSHSAMEALKVHIELGLQQIIEHCLAQRNFVLSGTDVSYRELICGDAPLMANAYDFLKRFDLNHWNASDLYRMNADTKPEILHKALECVVEQHDGLRRILVQDKNEWRQRFLLPYQMSPWWEEVDLSHISDSQLSSHIERHCDECQRSLDIQRILFRAVYFNTGKGREPRLLLVIHHLLIDLYGYEILLEDLTHAYRALSSGEPPRFLSKTTSIKYLSEIWQQRSQDSQVEKDLAFWQSLSWQRFKPLPEEEDKRALLPVGESAKFCSVVEELTREQTEFVLRSLEGWQEFDIADVVNCALVSAYGNWSGSKALCVLGGHNGRSMDFDDKIDLSRTIGWCMNYTRTPIDLNGCTSFLESVRETRRQCSQLNGREANYGLLRYVHPNPDIRQAMASLPDGQLVFAFVPLHVPLAQPSSTANLFIPAEENAGPNEGPMEPGFRPFGLSAVHEGKLCVRWSFCLSAYTEKTMRHFSSDTLQQVLNICDELNQLNARNNKMDVLSLGEEEK